MSPTIRKSPSPPLIRDLLTISGRISDRLETLRNGKDLTKQQVADATNLSLHFYETYELGASTPSLETTIKLADYFNVSLDYLTGRSDNPARQ